MALNGIYHDADHQGQQKMIALAKECFWWPMMVEDCKALVRGCPRCCAFEGAIPKAPLCPIRAHAPLELVHVDFTSMESTMELHKPPSIKNILVITDHFMCYALAVMMKDCSKGALQEVYYGIRCTCKAPKQPGSKLHLSAGGRVVRHVWHSEVPDYYIPPTM